MKKQHLKNVITSQIYQTWLYETFPKCFNGLFRPLSLGVFQELAEQLRRFMHWYTEQVAYIEAFFHNDFRVNLDGSDAQEIDRGPVEEPPKVFVLS